MKRGQSGLSLLVAVNKPKGMSSHDVVNRCRRIFGERRCGHTGTLDPLATGVLPVCIGPATRLDAFMVDHDKRYRVAIAFGASTSTDDAAGEILKTGLPPAHLYDEAFARRYLEGLVGVIDQLPPRYSAIKVDGRKSYEAARAGSDVDLAPRKIEVYEADLVSLDDDPAAPYLTWVVDLHVSKGTYIRSIARDAGEDLGCPAHVADLERRSAGRIGIEDCVSLESLENLKGEVAIDPVRALGIRFAFADELERFVNSGVALYRNQLDLYEPLPMQEDEDLCACTSGICASLRPAEPDETVAVIIANRVKALYRYDAEGQRWKAACVFSTPIVRG